LPLAASAADGSFIVLGYEEKLQCLNGCLGNRLVVDI
jgi:hypothetical protein